MEAKSIFLVFLFLGIFGSIWLLGKQKDSNSKVISYEVNPITENIQFYWKNEKGVFYSSFGRLKKDLEEKEKSLVFAMNGGMFNSDFNPTGLYIEKGKILSPLDTKNKGYGNFYMQPNGVFFI